MPSTDSLMAQYYSDKVSKLLLSAGFVMLLGLPFLAQKIPVPALVSVFLILILGLFSGLLTPPLKGWIMVFNLLASAIGLVVFEFFAVSNYLVEGNLLDLFFIINHVLAFIFLLALYFGAHAVIRKFIN